VIDATECRALGTLRHRNGSRTEGGWRIWRWRKARHRAFFFGSGGPCRIMSTACRSSAMSVCRPRDGYRAAPPGFAQSSRSCRTQSSNACLILQLGASFVVAWMAHFRLSFACASVRGRLPRRYCVDSSVQLRVWRNVVCPRFARLLSRQSVTGFPVGDRRTDVLVPFCGREVAIRDCAGLLLPVGQAKIPAHYLARTGRVNG